MPDELPMAPQQARPERADAALNRQRILSAASALFAERGIDNVTMHDVAREACVGVGTLYRRFGDRAGLALSLLDERERAFQDELFRGAPPLGPGAPPGERLRAFGAAYLEFAEQHAAVLVAAQGPLIPVGGPWMVYRTHVRLLLAEAAPAIDAEYAAEALIGTLGAALVLHLRRTRGWPLERLQAGWAAQVAAWLALAGRDG